MHESFYGSGEEKGEHSTGGSGGSRWVACDGRVRQNGGGGVCKRAVTFDEVSYATDD